METDRLRYFCAIAECESMTKAAEVLHISHSGLSKAMSLLQQETSCQLFRPVGRGIELTEQGREFYPRAKQILEMINKLTQPESLPHKEEIRIGMTEIFSISLSGDLAKALGSGTNLFEHDSGELEVQILNEKIDFAMTCVPFPHPELEYLKIKTAPMEAYLTNKELLKLPITEVPFVTPSIAMTDNPLSLKSRDGWPSQVSRTRSYGAGSLTSALRIVDSGLAAVFMPQFVANSLNRQRAPSSQLTAYGLDTKLLKHSARDIFIVKRKNLPKSKAMKQAARILRQIC